MKTLFWILVTAILAWTGGWLYAHNVIANECKRLGSFYVGKETFTCSKVASRRPGSTNQEDK